MEQERIRNFCIIAHIDHGKSTLADRLLEHTGTLDRRQMTEQVLDSMDLERERGITIKSHPVTMRYRRPDGTTYLLNLLDTPGHVDFTYEVSRSLAACEGALLVVDAAQGVEAQTHANYLLALEQGLEIVPVLNKIDLPTADPERVRREIEGALALPAGEALLVSAREDVGVEAVLQAVVERIPPPRGEPGGPLRALIFDSRYDPYRGVVPFVRVVDGRVRKGTRICLMSTGRTYEVTEVGVFRPGPEPVEELSAGEVGYLVAQIRHIAETRVGDTITQADHPAPEPLPGYREAVSTVFCGLYPTEPTEYTELRDALGKLKLNDAALTYEPETSAALGMGFRCGFLGLLHVEIVQERLEREFDLRLIATAPSVDYEVHLKDGTVRHIQNPRDLPPAHLLAEIREPVVKATLITPERYVGPVMELCQGRRGDFLHLDYLAEGRCLLVYHLPLGEILTDFFDRLKTRSRGYASFDYEPAGTRPADLVRLDVLVHGEPVDALSCIVHREKVYATGRALVAKLREVIPRQLFAVPIQAAVGGRVIARETVPALRKNVLARCYGGDVTRKRKLLEKQKEGKRRLKRVGRVDLPQEAFLAVLRAGGAGI